MAPALYRPIKHSRLKNQKATHWEQFRSALSLLLRASQTSERGRGDVAPCIFGIFLTYPRDVFSHQHLMCSLFKGLIQDQIFSLNNAPVLERGDKAGRFFAGRFEPLNGQAFEQLQVHLSCTDINVNPKGNANIALEPNG